MAAVSERRVAQGRALYTERCPAELYRGARSSVRERYARQASRLGAERPSTGPGRTKSSQSISCIRPNLCSIRRGATGLLNWVDWVDWVD